MAELLLELFSEEIPARMQKGGAEDLRALASGALSDLAPEDVAVFWGPRRIALSARVAGEVPASAVTERGPRVSAPDAAVAGFLRKHGAGRAQLVAEGDYWMLRMAVPARPAADLIAAVMPGLLRRFAWPKSMRWGGTSALTWVRPLRRILCVLDGAVVKFDLRDGEDDGHGLASGDLTEGHRFMAPGAFAVRGVAEWRGKLLERFVVGDAAERRARIADGLRAAAAARDLTVVADEGLLDEVTGLVEWPVPLLGRIDDGFMDLPPEVMQVSMRVNQRYFALRDGAGLAAPYFAFVANIGAPDGGAAIVAGNERVLRARFADARHFWDLDRSRTLESRLPALDTVTFHARLGSQGARARRLERLAGFLAPLLGADAAAAARAGLLAKADLTTGMVGEFPELQGVMGGYYAAHDGEAADVACAIGQHYLPKGPADALPDGMVAVTVALADRIDTLTGFFGIGELPTGSGDPYALRRAALGVLRILRERTLRIGLRPVIDFAGAGHAAVPDTTAVLAFLAERLRVQLRAEGARHDVLNAVFAASGDDDMVRLLNRGAAVAALLGTAAGADLLAAYRRGANILRIEEKKDGAAARRILADVDDAILAEPAERTLHGALAVARTRIVAALEAERDHAAMAELAALRPAVDGFFETVRVNDAVAAVRANRLGLLAALRDTMTLAADFSRIEG
jgi:glycyl-tRNA synthetase beta chain